MKIVQDNPNEFDVYQGNFLNGEFHGKGSFTFSNGNHYDGDWLHNNRNGKI